MTFISKDRPRRTIYWALGLGLLVRLAVFWHTGTLGTEIVDEQHYAQLATNLSAGNGFAWGPGQPTSIRPPLYPGLMAGIWSVAGVGNFQAVRLVQILLAALTSWLVFLIGRKVFDRSTGLYAATAVWLYPSLVFFNFTILTETLFTLLLTAFVWLAVTLVERPRAATALACGVTLGLAALTRSVLWPMPFLLCPLLHVLLDGSIAKRVAIAATLFAGFAVAVGPWAVRNTRLQRVPTVVDTMGGLNIWMGNYPHTPDERMWDAVSQTGAASWSYDLASEHPGETLTEGQKEKWAMRKAAAYIKAHPGVTARRTLIKFADFWGIEREYMAGVQQGLYNPPRWLGVGLALTVAVVYVVVAMTGVAGIWLAAPYRRADAILLLPVALILFGHLIAFGHSRYHVPLIPILALYGAALLTRWREIRWRGWQRIGVSVSIALLLLIWMRQLVLVDGPRIRRFFDGVL